MFALLQGSVYAVNSSMLLIKDFSYDGGGPDAFFYVGGPKVIYRIH